MKFWWPVAAVAGSRFACPLSSGSLNDSKCDEPESMADCAAAGHASVNDDASPQSIGQYSIPEGRVPPEVACQLYAQGASVLLKRLVSDTSLYARPFLPDVDPAGGLDAGEDEPVLVP